MNAIENSLEIKNTELAEEWLNRAILESWNLGILKFGILESWNLEIFKFEDPKI